MPLYESEEINRDQLDTIRQRNKCSECGGWLNMFYDAEKHLAFVACAEWPRSHHEGIEREASRWEQEGMAALNIPKRREIMTKELGPVKTREMERYMGVSSLTREEAKEILQAVFPRAPEAEITRAMILCANYQLNPLMKHVFLIPFKNKSGGEDWATVIGIKAKRLMASRRGIFSYIDNTPRRMTDQMQKDIFGSVDPKNLHCIVKLKDPATGAESVGYGSWPQDKAPYGMDKGNSQFNMAVIRAESQALDRLRPGEMPVGMEVVAESFVDDIQDDNGYIETSGRIIDTDTGEIKDKPEQVQEDPPHWCAEHNCSYEEKHRGSSVWWAHKLPDGSWCNEIKSKNNKKEEPAPEPPESTRKPLRDPDSIKGLTDLFKACHEDFKMQPDGVLKELGYKNQMDITESAADCYRKILSWQNSIRSG